MWIVKNYQWSYTASRQDFTALKTTMDDRMLKRGPSIPRRAIADENELPAAGVSA
jgi:hypothetical protein